MPAGTRGFSVDAIARHPTRKETLASGLARLFLKGTLHRSGHRSNFMTKPGNVERFVRRFPASATVTCRSLRTVRAPSGQNGEGPRRVRIRRRGPPSRTGWLKPGDQSGSAPWKTERLMDCPIVR